MNFSTTELPKIENLENFLELLKDVECKIKSILKRDKLIKLRLQVTSNIYIQMSSFKLCISLKKKFLLSSYLRCFCKVHYVLYSQIIVAVKT